MVLVTIASFKGSLQIISWPIDICAATFFIFQSAFRMWEITKNGKGLSRVRSGEWHSFNPTRIKPHPFFASLWLTLFTVHFVSLTEHFEQAVLSLDKLSIKAVMQTTSEYYRYFLRVCSEPFRKRNRETNWMQSPVV